MLASELYELGRGEMERRGLSLALDFVGHGLGIDMHETPYLIATDHTPLEPNMVVVLEASTRRSDLGHICAEITCLVTEDGCEVLNALPHTITHIPLNGVTLYGIHIDCPESLEFIRTYHRLRLGEIECWTSTGSNGSVSTATGRLVDWETGISTAVGEVLESHGVRRSRAEVLALFADVEPRVQDSQDYLEYRSVLGRVMAAIGAELGLDCTESELGCLADTLPEWPVFPDATQALNALKTGCRLAVISNVDDDLFAGTAENLGVDFDVVVTAQQVRSYKPSLRNFEAARARMGVDSDKWLHVAESLYHDIDPVNQLGISSVWVDRANRGGGTRITDAVPNLVVPDLAALARLTCRT